MDINKKKEMLKRYKINQIEKKDLMKLGKEKEVEEIEKEQRKIENAISRLNGYERIVINKKYILNKSFEEIADEINYSNSQTRRFHESGIKHIII